MRIIDERDLELKKARKISKKTYESNMYELDGKAYKMFKRRTNKEKLEIKKHKVLLLEDSTTKQIVKPDTLIMKKSKLSGLGMDYIENLGTLYDFSKVCKEVSKYLLVIRNASLGLKDIHNDPLEIVINDLTFFNIIFDEYLNTYYVDADSYEVGKFKATSIAGFLADYCKKRGLNPYPACPLFDRFEFAYCFIEAIFGRRIKDISFYEFDELAEKIETLKNMRLCFKQIKQCEKVPNIPYMCDLISDKDLNTHIEYDLPLIYNKYVMLPAKELTRTLK